jgi:hypothetical protein
MKYRDQGYDTQSHYANNIRAIKHINENGFN